MCFCTVFIHPASNSKIIHEVNPNTFCWIIIVKGISFHFKSAFTQVEFNIFWCESIRRLDLICIALICIACLHNSNIITIIIDNRWWIWTDRFCWCIQSSLNIWICFKRTIVVTSTVLQSVSDCIINFFLVISRKCSKCTIRFQESYNWSTVEIVFTIINCFNNISRSIINICADKSAVIIISDNSTNI